jgi:alpha-glucosidase
MYARQVFTNDPQYFPTSKMQEIVKYLHGHDQQYSELDRILFPFSY